MSQEVTVRFWAIMSENVFGFVDLATSLKVRATPYFDNERIDDGAWKTMMSLPQDGVKVVRTVAPSKDVHYQLQDQWLKRRK